MFICTFSTNFKHNVLGKFLISMFVVTRQYTPTRLKTRMGTFGNVLLLPTLNLFFFLDIQPTYFGHILRYYIIAQGPINNTYVGSQNFRPNSLFLFCQMSISSSMFLHSTAPFCLFNNCYYVFPPQDIFSSFFHHLSGLD